MSVSPDADDLTYNLYEEKSGRLLDPVGPIGLIALSGSLDFTAKVNSHLVKRRAEAIQAAARHPAIQSGYLRRDYRILADTQRFSTGEGRAVISQTVRGHDLFILVDVMNHSCTYDMFGIDKPMTPDEHYQDLKRVILAASGKARRINVIMPYLYEGRQHKRNSRESLDCSYMLKELRELGVENLITFDAHDPRVSNAIPLSGFENIQVAFQMLRSMASSLPDLCENEQGLMVVSPDEGGITRAMYFASMLGVPLGTFYKRRDYSHVINGRNPIVAHEFLGKTVEGRDILIVDDILSSGETTLEIAYDLHAKKARRIYVATSFALFTDGLEGIRKFDRAYQEGLITRVFSTNLTYRQTALLDAPWYKDVDMTDFVALLIDAINHDASLSPLIEPTGKIREMLDQIIG
ncbi:MAG TPA: ribose-phosphate pyrophosphokinase [Clostridia bacterium]